MRTSRGKRHGRIGHDRAEQRIGGIDGLDLDQRSTAVAGARHGPQVAATETVPCVVEKLRSPSLGFALNERERKIAAENQLPGAADAVGEARRHRTDAGDRDTPSAMQAMKTPKPRKPPRNSRQAKRAASCAL